MVANSTGSLPRNLAATLQDIETKRQLALQQKGNIKRWLGRSQRQLTYQNSMTDGLHHQTFLYSIGVFFRTVCISVFIYAHVVFSSGQQVIEEQRRRLAELKQKAAVEAQCQWEALHGSQTQLNNPFPSSPPPVVHHSILHHTSPSAGEQPYDTLSLESSDSMDTSISTGNNSACSPDNMSRLDIPKWFCRWLCDKNSVAFLHVPVSS